MQSDAGSSRPESPRLVMVCIKSIILPVQAEWIAANFLKNGQFRNCTSGMTAENPVPSDIPAGRPQDTGQTVQEERGADTPGAVDEDSRQHARGLPAIARRHAFQRQDNEPCDQCWEDRAEQEGRHPVRRPAREAMMEQSKDDAPDPSPEGGGQERRKPKGWDETHGI